VAALPIQTDGGEGDIIAAAMFGFGGLALFLVCGCSILRYTRSRSYYPMEPNALLRTCGSFNLTLWPSVIVILVITSAGLAVAYILDPDADQAPTVVAAAAVIAAVAAALIFLRYILEYILEFFDWVTFLCRPAPYIVTIRYEYTYNTNLSQIASTLCSCLNPCNRIFPTVQLFGDKGESRRRALYAMGTWGGGRVVGTDTINFDGPPRPGLRTTTRVYEDHPELKVSTEILEFTFRLPSNALGPSGELLWVDMSVPDRTALVILVHHLEVSRAGKSWYLPAFYKLGVNQHSTTIFEATAKLPQQCSDRERAARAADLVINREHYKWQEYTRATGFTNKAWSANANAMLPSACWFGKTATNDVPLLGFPASLQDNIPINEYFGVQKTLDFTLAAVQAGIAQFAANFFGTDSKDPRMKETWANTEEVTLTWKFTPMAPPLLWAAGPTAEAWQTDAEFSAQILQGVWPDAMEVATEVPRRLRPYLSPGGPGCASTKLPNGKTAAEMVRRKELLVVDLAFMLKYQNLAQAPFVASITALERTAGPEVLKPLGILLMWVDEDGKDVEQWYTPADSPTDWLLAKTYARSGMVNWHEAVVHATNCHLCTEPYVVAMHRCISSQHPIFKLLFPHVKYTILINFQARESLISPGGVFDEVSSLGGPNQAFVLAMADAYANFDPLQEHLPNKLRRKGLMADQGCLPEGSYAYRDFAMPLWGAIHDMVEGTILGYYKTEDDVLADNELGDFLRELETTGFPGGRFKASDFASRARLVELLTTVVFVVSARHAAVNFYQYKQLAYGPNFPLWMNRLPPRFKNTVRSTNEALSYMCTRTASVGQASVVWVLSQYGSQDLMLLQPDGVNARFQELFANGPGLREVIAFRDRLGKIEIDGRVAAQRTTKGSTQKYEVLLPSYVPESIAI